MTLPVLNTEADVLAYSGIVYTPAPVAVEEPKAPPPAHVPTPVLIPAPEFRQVPVHLPTVVEPPVDIKKDSIESKDAAPVVDEATLVEQLKHDHTIQELRTIAKDANLDTSGSKNDLATTVARSIIKNR